MPKNHEEGNGCMLFIITLVTSTGERKIKTFKFNGTKLLICCSISAADALARAIIRFKINGCGSSLVHLKNKEIKAMNK